MLQNSIENRNVSLPKALSLVPKIMATNFARFLRLVTVESINGALPLQHGSLFHVYNSKFVP